MTFTHHQFVGAALPDMDGPRHIPRSTPLRLSVAFLFSFCGGFLLTRYPFRGTIAGSVLVGIVCVACLFLVRRGRGNP